MEAIAIIYSRGWISYKEEGVVYDGNRRAVKLNSKIGFVELKRKIELKLNICGSEIISSLVYRYLGGPIKKYVSIDLRDHEDVSVMFELHEQKPSMIEIYVDIGTVGSSAMLRMNKNNLQWPPISSNSFTRDR